MRVDLVAVLDPSGHLPERGWRIRKGADADAVPLEGFDEGLGDAFDSGLLTGVKHGTRLSATAKSLVSLAV